MKKVIIAGATSGIGREIAKHYINDGYTVGVMGRREVLLDELAQIAPDRVHTAALDINADNAAETLLKLTNQMGGMDVYVHVSGVGNQNYDLNPAIELNIVNTNGMGFTRMLTAAFNYMAQQGSGHIAAVTSIAGTKGLGISPAYSATKRFQNTYLQCLAQLATIRKVNVSFTDIRPGFVATDLLKDKNYPMLMRKEPVGLAAYRAIERKKRVKTIDWRFAILVFFWQMTPRCIWERVPVK